MGIFVCLSNLGIDDASVFDGCDDMIEELQVVKKLYFAKILREHPDKGGDAATFRATRAAWQILRDACEQGTVRDGSFATYLGGVTTGHPYDPADRLDDDDDDDFSDRYAQYAGDTSMPSYEYYTAAAEEEMPAYKVESAKSGRSQCIKCKRRIEKAGLRVGSLDKVTGAYCRWSHVDCWRVPVRVQNGLTNPCDDQVALKNLLSMEDVLLTGVAALDDASKMLLVQHCVKSDHWAKYKRKHQHIMGNAATGSPAERAAPTKVAKTERPSHGSDTTMPAAGRCTVLVPGVDGALHDVTFLQGQTFVVSGSFPEVGGGGDAAAVGVPNVKAMIQSFGGKVTTRFSKNTTFLLVGQNAVASKFKDAKKRSISIISLSRLQSLLLGRISIQALQTLPTLTSDMCIGSVVHAVGAPFQEGQVSMAWPNACGSSAEHPGVASKVPAAHKPSKLDTNAVELKPVTPTVADVVSSTAHHVVSTGSHAVVARAPSNNKKKHASAVVRHTGNKGRFQVLRPGVNGAIAGVLGGKRLVLTGVFPEVGGGTGLTLGKDRTKSMIESFGGRVTSAVSGKTDLVLVGKEPGRSKVGQAGQRGVPLISLLSLQHILLGQQTLEGVAAEPPPRITNFSAGYTGQYRLGY